jgi:succinate dehydrogenase / fumarate reductase membrane anchor subunit
MSAGIQNTSAPRSSENSWLWLIKIVTGPLLIVLILIHFIVNHFIGQNGLLTYADVVAYYSNPLIPLMEIVFLITVVTHSLIGLRGIILDLKPSRSVLAAVNWLLALVGIAAVSYGAWLALVIASRS